MFRTVQIVAFQLHFAVTSFNILTCGSTSKFVDFDPNDRTVNISSLIKLDQDSNMNQHFLSNSGSPGSITVILSQFKRNNSLEQLDAIISQTIPVDSIYVYQNENHVDLQFLDTYYFSNCQRVEMAYCHRQPSINVIQNKQENFRYHGRFSIPLLINTEYVVIFDDDIIPGPNYVENCLRTSRFYNAICGAAGQILAPERKIMVFAPVEEDIEVDSVGWSWLFKTAWIRYFWSDEMPTFSQAEDISFGMSIWKNAGIRSFVARQRADERSHWGNSQHYGDDDHASYKKRASGMIRWAVGIYWIQEGFVPLALRQALESTIVEECKADDHEQSIHHRLSYWISLKCFIGSRKDPSRDTTADDNMLQSSSVIPIESMHRCRPPSQRGSPGLCVGAASPHTARILDLVRANGYLPSSHRLQLAYAESGNNITTLANSFITAAPRDIQQTLHLR